MTDALLAAFEAARKNEPNQGFQLLKPHFERHLEVAAAFLSAAAQTNFADEIEKSKNELAEILDRVSRRSLPVQTTQRCRFGLRRTAFIETSDRSLQSAGHQGETRRFAPLDRDG